MSEHKLTVKSVAQEVGVKFYIKGADILEARIKDEDKVQLEYTVLFNGT
jgi:uncharacterized membrane protein